MLLINILFKLQSIIYIFEQSEHFCLYFYYFSTFIMLLIIINFNDPTFFLFFFKLTLIQFYVTVFSRILDPHSIQWTSTSCLTDWEEITQYHNFSLNHFWKG